MYIYTTNKNVQVSKLRYNFRKNIDATQNQSLGKNARMYLKL